jgi:hypothetical protein
MRKILLLPFLFLLFESNVLAKNVDLTMAQRIGINFFYEKFSQRNAIDYTSIKTGESFTLKYDNIPVYYVFNFTGTGFIIVSADDAVTPILAYSPEGFYQPDDQAPQFISWMEGYSKQIVYAVKNAVPATTKISQEWQRLSTNDPATLQTHRGEREVSPLLLSTWDQGSHYNKLCPVDAGGSGGHVWAGCVATAMCQVMYYYRFPDSGNGQHCYVPSGYPEQCADFQNTVYQWNEMPLSFSNNCFNDTATAMLLWHAGISVDMMYGAGGSGAYSEDALTSMINIFKYSPNAHLEERDAYPPNGDEFPAILRDNLDHKRVMYYDGYGSGGHAFNVDGYQGTDYFHFNWGWSGSANGYYYLNNLNPGGYNFNNGQKAMVNLYPDTLSYNYPGYCNGQTILHALGGTIEDGSGPLKTYSENSSCSWLIEPQSLSDSITGINLTFNKFETEAGQDVLRIYQGTSTSDLMIAEFSGDDIPGSLNISGNKALITFTSNSNIEKTGWFITYVSESMSWCHGTTKLTESSGEINDGSLNFNYKNNSSCRWRIEPEGADHVTLYFNSFNTEAGQDNVRIYDLETEELLTEISGNYSSNLPGPITSPSGRMFVIFNTSPSYTDQGWSASYNTFPAGCEEKNDLSGILVYPNPASNFFRITGQGLNCHQLNLELSDIQGKEILHSSIFLNHGRISREINIEELRPGTYFLKLISENDVVLKKILVR